MLVNKFLQKNKLVQHDGQTPLNAQELMQKELRLEALVTKEFDRFIEKQTFTQKNLLVFEFDLKAKIDGILKNDGLQLSHDAFKNNTYR